MQTQRKVIYEQNGIEFVQCKNNVYAERISNGINQEIDYEEVIQAARKIGIYGNWERCVIHQRWQLVG
jgi:hypothetical protein